MTIMAFSMQIQYNLLVKQHLPRTKRSQSLKLGCFEYHAQSSSKLCKIVQGTFFLLAGEFELRNGSDYG